MSFDLSTDSAIVATQEWFDTAYNRNDYDKVVVKVKEGQDTPVVKTAIENQINKRDKIVSGTTASNAGDHLPDLRPDHDLRHCNRGNFHGRCRGLDFQHHDDVGQ